ncbi:MAG: hypothetical protein BWZ03_00128 [bacterium ADurb.BinA186]|nr:MAG: hypothetical protein BWZ03_00128 [bacterium ADurb.BinA186]
MILKTGKEKTVKKVIEKKVMVENDFEPIEIDGILNLSISKIQIMNGDDSSAVTNLVEATSSEQGISLKEIKDQHSKQQVESYHRIRANHMAVRLFLDSEEIHGFIFEIYFHKGSLSYRVIKSNHCESKYF